jgi:hypothetical protein
MREHAPPLQVKAMVGVRFDATEVIPGLTEVLCDGSAVVTPAVDVAQDIAASPAHAPDRPLCSRFWQSAAHLALDSGPSRVGGIPHQCKGSRDSVG